MPRRPMTSDDLWKLPRVGAPIPSPDGRLVLVPVSAYDVEDNRGTTRLWLVPADARDAGTGRTGDPARPLTTAEASTGAPAWSPDSSRIAFIRKPPRGKNGKKKSGPEHADVGQIYVMPVDGGEPERLTDLPLGVADPRWFPDGRRIAFLSPLQKAAPTVEKTAEWKKERADDPVRAHVTEARFYRFWDQWLTDERFFHIFVLDTTTGDLQDLTPDLQRLLEMDDAGVFSIAPDGREIAFTGVRGGPSYDHITEAVYTFRVPARVRADGKPPRIRELTRQHGADAGRPVYSPDGRYLVYGMSYETDFYADRTRLVAYDRVKKTHKVLTEDWDFSAAGWRFGKKPRRLFLLAEVDARSAIFEMDLGKAVRSPKANPPRELVRGGTYGAPQPAGGRIFAGRSSLTEAPEVFSIPEGEGPATQLTAFTAAGMKDFLMSKVEDVRFEGAEGDEVQMFVLHPPGESIPGRGKKPKRTRPLVHMIHGGPHGVFGDVWHWRWNAQVFAAPGYYTALVNFHGSTSWGQDFAASILGRWGDQPYQDIMKATDWLVKRGYANRRRIAVTGGSYGGYLVSWIASQTKRFACIVNHAGVCDFQTQYASDWTQGRNRSMGGEPWDRIEGMDRYNPMRHAAGFHSPMLVIHGMRDYRVPYNQALEIYNVHKAMKIPARLVVYPDENHWILKPKNSLHWYAEVDAWLARWLT